VTVRVGCTSRRALSFPCDPAGRQEPDELGAAWHLQEPPRHRYGKGVSDYISRALVADALAEWRALLRAQSTVSPLRDLSGTHAPLIDLKGAHPSGLAPLFAGRATLLSTLLRDVSAYEAAAPKARQILADAEAVIATAGRWTAALVVGTARWDGVEMPLLLRPVSIDRAREDDVAITLRHEVTLNPVFASLLRDLGGPVSLVELAPTTLAGREFDPRPVWNEVRELGDILPGVEVSERLVLGSYDDPEQRLLDDLDDLDPVIGASDVIAAIAGDGDAATILAEPLPRWSHGDRDPFGERGLGDLDDAAFMAVDLVALGRDIAIDAPPGCDVHGVVAAIVADAAASGRTAAVVSDNSETLAALDLTLAEAGAGEIALTGGVEQWHADARARLLESLTLAAPEVNEDDLRVVGEGALSARADAVRRLEALHRPRRPWGASAFEAVQAIVRLTAQDPAPGTSLRLGQAAATAVAEHGLAHVVAALVARLHGSDIEVPSRLAEPEPEPAAPAAWWARVAESPEHGAALDEALAAMVRALPGLRSDAATAASATGLDRAENLAVWAEQVSLFTDVQVTLDTFAPAVYHRSLADLVEATAPKGDDEASQMRRSTRRALARRARELLRPGRDASTTHERLKAAAREAERWREMCSAGGWPTVPDDFQAYEARLERAVAAWAILVPVLPAAAGIDEPELMPLGELERALHELAEGIPGGLDSAPAAPAQIDLDEAGFAPLIASLEERAASPEQIRADAEFAWWAAAFDSMIEAEPALIEAGALGHAVARYLQLDEAFGDMRSGPLMRAVAEHRKQAIARRPEDARDLFATLMEGVEVSVRQMRRDFGAVVAALRPVVLARADQVSHMLPPSRCVDVLVIVGAESLATAQLIPALARAAQVVLVTDPRSATRSGATEISRLLPHVTLHPAPWQGEPAVGLALQSLGYGRDLPVLPRAGVADAPSGIEAIVLDAVAQPLAGRHVVETTRAEVAAVVERCVAMAEGAPHATQGTTLVVAGNAAHALRLREALAERAGGGRPAAEVVECGDAVRRGFTSVMLSLGYARDHRGGAPTELGVLGTSQGAAALAQALAASDGRVVVVSALDAHHLRGLAASGAAGHGIDALAGLLEASEVRPSERTHPGPADWLLADVARLLRAEGFAVSLRHGFGAQTIALAVGAPHGRGYSLAVITDEPAEGPRGSLRDSLRWQYRGLESLGWSVLPLWTLDTFMDPLGAVAQIRAALGVHLPAASAPEAADAAAEVTAHPDDAGDEPASAEADDAHEGEEASSASSWLDELTGGASWDDPEDGDSGGDEAEPWAVSATSDEVEPAPDDQVAVDGDEEPSGATSPLDDAQPESDDQPEPEPGHRAPRRAESPGTMTTASGDMLPRRPITRGVDRPLIPTRAWEDEDAGWGDRGGANRDDEIKRDKPPHW